MTRSFDRGCGNTVSAVGGVAHGLDVPSDRLAALSSEHLAVVPTETIGHDHGMEHESARARVRTRFPPLRRRLLTVFDIPAPRHQAEAVVVVKQIHVFPKRPPLA